MLLLALLLLLQIVLLRLNLIARTSREQQFLAVWRPLLAAVIANAPVDLPPLTKRDHAFFLKLWNHLQESLRGEAKARLNAVAERCGTVPYARALLRKNGLQQKLVALLTLGHLGDRSAWNDIVRLAKKPDTLLSLAAARALFQIDAKAALHELLPQVLQRQDWPVIPLTSLLKENGTEDMFDMLSDLAAALSGSANHDNLAQLKRLLYLLETTSPQCALGAVRTVLAQCKNDEIIADCLKFLCEPGDLPIVQSHLGHPSWVVRLQAARALGRIGTREDLPHLTTLLSDSSWWVRYRAAQALVVLTRGESRALSQLKSNLTDRYARDMLDMAMAEQGAQ